MIKCVYKQNLYDIRRWRSSKGVFIGGCRHSRWQMKGIQILAMEKWGTWQTRSFCSLWFQLGCVHTFRNWWGQPAPNCVFCHFGCFWSVLVFFYTAFFQAKMLQPDVEVYSFAKCSMHEESPIQITFLASLGIPWERYPDWYCGGAVGNNRANRLFWTTFAQVPWTYTFYVP